jgi:hypothetical protein
METKEGEDLWLEELANRKLLLARRLGPESRQGIRLELFDPGRGKSELLLEDEASAAALTPDQKTLWLSRRRQEGDVWLARLEAPQR